MTMKMISNVSRKKPSTKMIRNTTASAPNSPPGICSRKPRTIVVPPSWVNTSAKDVAPRRMMNTIEVIDIVDTDDRKSVSK